MKRSRGIWFGTILMTVGVLLLLDNVDVVDFGEIVQTYWPVLMIILGLSIIGRRSSSREREDRSALGGQSASDANQLSASTVFGDYSTAIQSQSFAGGRVSTTFGDIDIDLLSAQLADGEHSLGIEGVFGDTVLRLPKGMAVTIHANTTFGDVAVNDQNRDGISPSLDYTSPDFQTAGKRLRVVTSRVFGDITVL